jgi:pregnancy-associated plasma protein-A
MRAKTVLLVLTSVMSILSGPAEPARADECQGGANRGRRCTTPPSTGGGKALTARALAAARPLQPGERIVVPVVYHVVYDSYVPQGGPGDLPDDLEHAPPPALVELQTEALNSAFRGTAFSFSTADVQLDSFTRWRGRGLGYPPLEDIVKMIRVLNAERPGVLHVFLMRKYEETAAPPDTKRMFDAFRRPTDGILMPWDYLPYEPSLRPVENPLVALFYHQGETLVHLVGHYLGLLHTYEPWPGKGIAGCTSKCAQISDRVRDTPVHIRNVTESCRSIDTCPEYPGLDPVNNYMNAEPDVCTSEFTAGQVNRMERMVRAFRPHFIVAAPAGQP